MVPENNTNEAVAKKPDDAPIIGPVATVKEQSENNEGTTHALIPAEDFVVWLDPSVVDKPAQIIEATEANLRTIAAAAPDVDYRLDKVKNTGMTKLTRLTESDWPAEVVVAMGENCVFISESLEDMLFERTLPLDANVAPLFRQMVSVVKSYGESIGDEALNLISFAYVENCGRFSNQKRDFNMEYSGKSLIAVGGVAQSIVKKAYTWANTMPQFQADLLMHTALEQDKLVFTSKGIMVVFPSNAEPGAFELDTFKDIFGGTLTVSVPMFVSSKKLVRRTFVRKAPVMRRSRNLLELELSSLLIQMLARLMTLASPAYSCKFTFRRRNMPFVLWPNSTLKVKATKVPSMQVKTLAFATLPRSPPRVHATG